MKNVFLLSLLSAIVMISSCGECDKVDEFPIVIDYSISIDDLLLRGSYEFISRHRSNNSFMQINGNDQKDSIIKTSAFLLNFDQKISSEEVISLMKIQGLRPATARELLIFGCMYPDLQCGGDVVALGLKTTESLVPVIGGCFSQGNILWLWYWSSDWNEYQSFLAFRE